METCVCVFGKNVFSYTITPVQYVGHRRNNWYTFHSRHAMSKKTRLKHIVSALARTYPNAKIALTYKNPWELLVAVILSAQSTDNMVNTVTPKLFTSYPDVYALSKASQSDVEKIIHSVGFFRNKSKNIIAAAKTIAEHFDGNMPKTINDMCTIPGVARKTANTVLGVVYGATEGIAVDTHVLRLSQRLRMIPLKKTGGTKKGCRFVYKNKSGLIDFYANASPEKIERFLMGVLPKSQWQNITYMLIDHGRAVCKAKNPNCQNCSLSSCCPVKRKQRLFT